METTCVIVLLSSLILSAGTITEGCIWNAGNTPGHPAVTAIPSVPGTEQPETPAPLQQPGLQTGSYPGLVIMTSPRNAGEFTIQLQEHKP